MSYQIVLEKRAAKFIRKQTAEQQKRLLEAISELPSGDTKPLQATDGLYRLRVGSYRVIYRIDHNIVLIIVIDVGNRGQIYNQY